MRISPLLTAGKSKYGTISCPLLAVCVKYFIVNLAFVCRDSILCYTHFRVFDVFLFLALYVG